MSFQYPYWDIPSPYNYTIPTTTLDDTPPDLMDMSYIDPSLRSSHIDVNLAYTWHPVQRYLSQPEKSLFTVSPPLDFDRAYDASGPLLSPPHRQSPASESLSSGQSPRADAAFQHDHFLSTTPYGGHALARTISANSSHLSHEPELVWPQQQQQQAAVMVGHINMSEVQGVPDSQEVEFDNDEGNTDTEAWIAKPEAADDEDSITVQRRYGRHFRHASDGDSGVVLKDEASLSPEPQPQRRDVGVDTEQDLARDSDIDIDIDADLVSLPQDPSDSEADTSYHPTRRPRARPRPRRLRRTRPPSTKPTKPARTAPPPDSPRAYTCVFHFAGCGSSFSSKNEWKRHVSSQHLCLSTWRCRVGICATKPASEFNRKDLFTQHLRRMHAPAALRARRVDTATAATAAAGSWNARVAALQRESLVQRRAPPRRARCPATGCGRGFEGPRAWDERMEHVGRHLAAVGKGREEGGWGQGEQGLVEWAVGEGVLERRGEGWGLVGEGERGGRAERGGVVDEDCEGEEE